MDLTTFTPSSALVTVVLLAIAPFIAVMVTSFTKLVVVFSLLRNALGLQQVPPDIVLNGLAIVLLIYVMYPVGLEMSQRLQNVQNIGANTNNMLKAVDAAKEPLREFLIKHSRPVERAFFLKTAQRALNPEQAQALTDRDFIVIIPAFTVSELAVAFEIGFSNIPTVPRHRSGDLEHPDGHGHDDALANHRIDAVQAAPVRAHRRLGEAHPRPDPDLPLNRGRLDFP